MPDLTDGLCCVLIVTSTGKEACRQIALSRRASAQVREVTDTKASAPILANALGSSRRIAPAADLC